MAIFRFFIRAIDQGAWLGDALLEAVTIFLSRSMPQLSQEVR